MKARIRPYTGYILRQNLSFIIAAIVFLCATVGLFFYFNQRISEVDAKSAILRAEIARLSAKRAALRSVVGEGTQNLNADLQLMTMLIPDTEDYFSIINALERLSAQTGFRVDSYTINLLASTSSKLSITVIGTGDSATFLNFLNNYQVNGGRLITAEHIGIDPQETGSIRLDLNFYNKKASEDLATGSATIAPSLSELNDIKSKITFSLLSPAEEQPIQDYPTKQDPF